MSEDGGTKRGNQQTGLIDIALITVAIPRENGSELLTMF